MTEDQSVNIRPSQTEEDWETEIQLEVMGFEINEEAEQGFNQTIRETMSI